jgi:hypothetical protein
MANIPVANRLGESACRFGLHRDSIACAQLPIHLKRVQAGEKPYYALLLSPAFSVLSSVVLASIDLVPCSTCSSTTNPTSYKTQDNARLQKQIFKQMKLRKAESEERYKIARH